MRGRTLEAPQWRQDLLDILCPGGLDCDSRERWRSGSRGIGRIVKRIGTVVPDGEAHPAAGRQCRAAEPLLRLLP